MRVCTTSPQQELQLVFTSLRDENYVSHNQPQREEKNTTMFHKLVIKYT